MPIHAKEAGIQPLSDAAKEWNRIQSANRACGEYVFGCMTTSMGGKQTRGFDLERNEAWWALTSLTVNFLSNLQTEDSAIMRRFIWLERIEMLIF
jgi:hypothetical protein